MKALRFIAAVLIFNDLAIPSTVLAVKRDREAAQTSRRYSDDTLLAVLRHLIAPLAQVSARPIRVVDPSTLRWCLLHNDASKPRWDRAKAAHCRELLPRDREVLLLPYGTMNERQVVTHWVGIALLRVGERLFLYYQNSFQGYNPSEDVLILLIQERIRERGEPDLTVFNVNVRQQDGRNLNICGPLTAGNLFHMGGILAALGDDASEAPRAMEEIRRRLPSLEEAYKHNERIRAMHARAPGAGLVACGLSADSDVVDVDADAVGQSTSADLASPRAESKPLAGSASESRRFSALLSFSLGSLNRLRAFIFRWFSKSAPPFDPQPENGTLILAGANRFQFVEVPGDGACGLHAISRILGRAITRVEFVRILRARIAVLASTPLDPFLIILQNAAIAAGYAGNIESYLAALSHNLWIGQSELALLAELLGLSITVFQNANPAQAIAPGLPLAAVPLAGAANIGNGPTPVAIFLSGGYLNQDGTFHEGNHYDALIPAIVPMIPAAAAGAPGGAAIDSDGDAPLPPSNNSSGVHDVDGSDDDSVQLVEPVVKRRRIFGSKSI